MSDRKKHVIKKKKKKTEYADEEPTVGKSCLKRTASPKVSANLSGSTCCRTSALKKYDASGVKRIYSPFGKLSNHSLKKKSRYKPYRSPFINNDGLSPKEKCYVLTSCQTRSTRYIMLKSLALEAERENKIFTIYGTCAPLRKALVERRWVEKIPPSRMNLQRVREREKDKDLLHGELERILLSNFVEKRSPNLVWSNTQDDPRGTCIDLTNDTQTLFNKLNGDVLWTTKQGLCSAINSSYWFYIEDVSEVNGPRTYMSYDAGEMEDFIQDYQLTACTSLLKWILAMVNHRKPIFVEDGQIPLNVIVFALNRCKEFLFKKQHKDIDKTLNKISTGQWNAFLKNYYKIIAREELFEVSKDSNKLPIYLGFAKYLLKEIYRYRPQLGCEGCHNIWIIKPTHCSRGRGIRMASQLGVINNLVTAKSNSKYVIQKYIEEPLLIHDTKFDVRQYYLVTSTNPLVIWMYKDCYLKFSSQKYNLKNFHESIHLTNNAVQKKYNNCTDRHPELPKHNMWDLDTYKTYLIKIGKEKVWEKITYPGMKKCIVGVMLGCQDFCTGVSKNRFELYGCDFILDKEYKPWLIEINSNPDLNPTTQVTAKVCSECISDVIKVIIDRAANPKAPTGKFECVYRQATIVPKYGQSSELIVRGHALPLDYFYKGDVKFDERIQQRETQSKRDIHLILEKLKNINETYPALPMIHSEDDQLSNVKKEKETLTYKTLSELELDEAAIVITSQLDELLDKITSIPQGDQKSINIVIPDIKPIDDFLDVIKEEASSKHSQTSVHIQLEEDGTPENTPPTPENTPPIFANPDNVEIFDDTELKKYKDIIDSQAKADLLHTADEITSFLNKIEMEYKIDCGQLENKLS